MDLIPNAGTISGVFVDGSVSTTVTFNQPYQAYVSSVNVQYTPSTDTGYQISTEVLPVAPATSVGTSLSGFVLVARGGPVGATDTFTYSAEGI